MSKIWLTINLWAKSPGYMTTVHQKGECTYHFKDTFFFQTKHCCLKTVSCSLLAFDILFIYLIVGSHSSTHWLSSPMSDWSDVWIENVTWADRHIDCAIRWHNQPSGTISGSKAELPIDWGRWVYRRIW